MKLQPWEEDNTYRPQVGDPIAYLGRRVGVVAAVEGNLCWTRYDGKDDSQPFIWRFWDGLNKLHSWPGKPEVTP